MPHRHCIFFTLKVYGNSVSGKYVGTIFPTAFAHFMSPCHISLIFTILQIFHFYICYADLQPVIFDVTVVIELLP